MKWEPFLLADGHVLVGEFPLATFPPGGVSSVTGKMNGFDALLLRFFCVEMGESIVSKTPTRNKERCFLRSAKVHAPPDSEGTGYRTAGIGDEVEAGNVTGSGTTDVVGGANRPPFIVFIVTETWMSIVLSLTADVVRIGDVMNCGGITSQPTQNRTNETGKENMDIHNQI